MRDDKFWSACASWCDFIFIKYDHNLIVGVNIEFCLVIDGLECVFICKEERVFALSVALFDPGTNFLVCNLDIVITQQLLKGQLFACLRIQIIVSDRFREVVPALIHIESKRENVIRL